MGKPKTDDLNQPDSLPSTPRKSKQRHTRNQIACDWCHSNHARCDRRIPCSRCVIKGTQCDFTRVRRKRGRIPKLDFVGTRRLELEKTNTSPNTNASSPDVQSTYASTTSSAQTPEAFQQGLYSAHDLTVFSSGAEDLRSFESAPWPMQGFEAKANAAENLLLAPDLPSHPNDSLISAGLNDSPFPLELLNVADFAEDRASAIPGLGVGAATSPHDITPTLRYPVLQPLMPFLQTALSPELACDLLDLYFTSAFPTHMHPVCQHLHCFVLRKPSFLNARNYRPSSLALLASMLWVASSDDHALSLPIPAHYQKTVCAFLGSLTIKLLKPLMHMPPNKQGDTSLSKTIFSESDLGNLPQANLYPSRTSDDVQGFECTAGSLDDVITCIHIASIVSSSKEKALSSRWWYAAFTLAREQKLNKEMEQTPRVDSQDVCFSYRGLSFDSSGSTRKARDCVCYRGYSSTIQVTEEQREERRRAWWLLYMMDRHLALCYDRPLMLLDSESKDLLLPLDEESWQAGEIHSNSPNFMGPQCILSGPKNMRRQMVDLNQIKNHPLLGSEVLGKDTWETQLNEVLHQLHLYEASLTTFITSALDLEASSLSTRNYGTTERSQTQAYLWLSQTITSYASYYIDLLHMFQKVKWDPVSLMESKDFWTSSPSLTSAIPHALKAADSVRQILKFDPDVSFMPHLFGTQLLKGGFYFLLILERLQDKAGELFLSACEVIIRATESCIITLDTGYLSLFCQIMRSTVAQARGRPANPCEMRQRHRAILALYNYNWTRVGTEVAV